MIVTISGKPGSGKSTVAKLLAEKLGYEFISMGDLRGKYAQEHGMTIDELNASADPKKHRLFDEYSANYMKNNDNIVFDSWLAWFFAPKEKIVHKVFLDVDTSIAAQRIFDNQRPDEKQQSDVDAVRNMIVNRLNQWRSDVIKLYGKDADFLEMKNYNQVIDTSRLSVEEVVSEIYEQVS